MNSPIETMKAIQEDQEREIAKRAGAALLIFLSLLLTLFVWIANTKGFESPLTNPKSTFQTWEQ